jgi:hypothetical protein
LIRNERGKGGIKLNIEVLSDQFFDYFALGVTATIV